MKRSTVRWMSLTCGVAILAAACDTGGPDAVAPSSRNRVSGDAAAAVSAQARSSNSELLGLLPPLSQDSSTLYVCTADSVAHTGSANIGILGGKVTFGGNTLIVPPGAVLRNTTITATAPGDGHLSAVFQPAGLQFLVPPVLTLSYRQCATPPANTAKIVYLQSLLGDLLEDSADDAQPEPVQHFGADLALLGLRSRGPGPVNRPMPGQSRRRHPVPKADACLVATAAGQVPVLPEPKLQSRGAELLAAGRRHEREGRSPEALLAYGEAAASGEARVRAEALRRKGAVHRRRHEWDAAMALLRDAYDAAQSAGDPIEAAETLNAMGAVHSERGELAQAREVLTRALAAGMDHDELRGRIEQNFGIIANIRAIFERHCRGTAHLSWPFSKRATSVAVRSHTTTSAW